MTALVIGTLLGLGALTFVLYPLLVSNMSIGEVPTPQSVAPQSSEAVDALREIEFDRETGKLSDDDYGALKASYTQRAINEMRSAGSSVCPNCGPRPEAGARYCSNCGIGLGG